MNREEYKNNMIKNNIFLSGIIKFMNGIITINIIGKIIKGAITLEYFDKIFLRSNPLIKNWKRGNKCKK